MSFITYNIILITVNNYSNVINNLLPEIIILTVNLYLVESSYTKKKTNNCLQLETNFPNNVQNIPQSINILV